MTDAGGSQRLALWPEEYEGFRAEAREATLAAMPMMDELRTAGADLDPMARLQAQREAMARMEVVVPEGVDREIAGLRCRTFVPEGPPSATYLHLHGGGMILGRPEMNDLANRALARRHGLSVVSVDYRLAPEHPYPAGIDDAVAVAAWLVEHAAEQCGTDRIIVGGESAGGYLAAATVLRIRDELGAIDRVLGANLQFGVYDWGRSPSQRGMRPVDGPDWLDPDGIAAFAEAYLPARTDDERRDPAISPAFADLRGLPPALVTIGTADHLLDDSLLLATRWAAAGSPVELAVYPDAPHGLGGPDTELGRRAAARTDAFLAALLRGT